MSKSVLIIGGAGYIGSVLAKSLLEKKYKVTVIDNFFYKQLSLIDCASYKNFNLHVEDVRNYNSIKTIVNKNDIIIPLAALVGAPICEKFPKMSDEINFDANINIINRKSKNQIIIMPTTNSAYGKGDKNNFCDEKSKLNPLSNYAKQKVKLEKILMEKENVTSLRLATVFGASPRMRIDLLVNNFVFKAHTDKYVVLYESNFKRNYIHVKDVARCFELCINSKKALNNIFNVGLSDTNISKLELAKRVKKVYKDLNIIQSNYKKDPDQRDYIVSNKKIESIGFKAKYSLDDGIKELSKIYKYILNNKLSNI
tara:strand:- start:4 stop:939 length:936 start_codon:yes stop_codon:yes gene_type:complete